MNKRVFVSFALVAALFAVLIPVWAFSRDGAAEERTASDEASRDLFVTNCGSCHSLEAAGTDGIVGPNLDDRLAPAGPAEGEAIDGTRVRVMSAIETGLGNGRMPADILQGAQAEQVSEYVARTAGQ
ncbi:MAG: c-type cytochrome [Actinomycetota bacterium]|nr:c-type cytochrome [Actinomycetota bacterium]